MEQTHKNEELTRPGWNPKLLGPCLDASEGEPQAQQHTFNCGKFSFNQCTFLYIFKNDN